VIAWVGHVCWHAGTMSPSRHAALSRRAPGPWPATNALDDMVHFSITPQLADRHVGVQLHLEGPGNSYWNQLNRRTWIRAVRAQ